MTEQQLTVPRLRRSPAVVPLEQGSTASSPIRSRAPHFPAAQGSTAARIGSLEVRLAGSAAEVRAAQALRYKVFYEELSAVPGARTKLTRRDADRFDPLCDHLVVLDHDRAGSRWRSAPEIVGTYRLLRQDVAERSHGFYTASEFEIAPLLARKRQQRFLELGRSCVLDRYRNRRTVELLWRGIWAYALQHEIDVLFGCASLEGTDPERLAVPLSFLHHKLRAPEDWCVQARPERRVEMNRVALADIDAAQAIRRLPSLIKGYLRLGAFVGDGAVLDRQFGTTDICVVLPVERIGSRYLGHFGAEARPLSS